MISPLCVLDDVIFDVDIRVEGAVIVDNSSTLDQKAIRLQEEKCGMGTDTCKVIDIAVFVAFVIL